MRVTFHGVFGFVFCVLGLLGDDGYFCGLFYVFLMIACSFVVWVEIFCLSFLTLLCLLCGEIF